MESGNYVIKLELSADKETVEKIYALVIAEIYNSNQDVMNILNTGISISIRPAFKEIKTLKEIEMEVDEAIKKYLE